MIDVPPFKPSETITDRFIAFCKRNFFDYQVYSVTNPNIDPNSVVQIRSTFINDEQKFIYYPQKRFTIPLFICNINFWWTNFSVQTGYDYYEPKCFDNIEEAVEYMDNYKITLRQHYEKNKYKK